MRECKNIQKDPPVGILAEPLEDNIFEWHFTIKGVEKTDFEGTITIAFFLFKKTLFLFYENKTKQNKTKNNT